MFASAVSLYFFLHICFSSLTTPVTGNNMNLTAEADTHSINLTWINPYEEENCTVNYTITWKDITVESINGSDFTENNSYVIEGLEACVTFEISVSAFCENFSEPSELIEPETAIKNVTTLADVPGQVENLTLIAGSNHISVNWSEPNNNSYCVVHYVITWVPTEGDSSGNETVLDTVDFFVIEDLDACVEYEVSVDALNVKNLSTGAVPGSVTTLTAVPDQVENLTLIAGSNHISVNWNEPSNNIFCVVHYVITWVPTEVESSGNKTVLDTVDFFVIEDLDACVEYEVSVDALNEHGLSTGAVRGSVTTLTAVPGQVENLDLKPGSHDISVNWNKPSNNIFCVVHYVITWVPTEGESSGNKTVLDKVDSFVIEHLDACVEYEVSVEALNEHGLSTGAVTDNTTTQTAVPGAPEHERISCLETEKVCLVWNLPDLSKNRCTILNATVNCNAEDNSELTVANGSTTEFKNDSFVINVVGLSPSTAYNCVAYITNEAGSSKKSLVQFITESAVPIGMIIGVLFAILAIGLIAVMVVTYRKGILVWPPKLFTKPKQATVRPQPVLLKKFPEYCTQMLDTPTRLGSEYQLLATLSADISEANSFANGQLPENRRKNRYINILPYDATRVTLDLIDGDPNSHYINGSFIKGYSDQTEYIATQGPKEETCLDFWRMVFQYDVRVIVMVTNLVEQDKVKCHQYYPNCHESVAFGDMTIRCTTQTDFPIHTARTLVLIKGDKRRTLSHLHFREWPDFGVPESTDVMIHFCQTVRHHTLAAEGGPILVHCSAGVGRTGTLIAVDILLQQICENKKVDIFGTVFELRKQRVNMVQTEGQYTYIYRCIKDAVQDPTIVNLGTASNNQLEPIYENVGTSLNPLQYEKLPQERNKNGVA